MSERAFEFQVCALPAPDVVGMRALADAAHAAGFDRFWVSDQTFFADPFVTLHDLALHAPIALGLAVTNPFVRHPVQLARAMATLAHLHPDRRWIFGLGTANKQNVLEPLGVRLARAPQNVRAAIDVIRRLVAGEEVTLEDERLAFSLRRVRLDVDPAPAFDLYIGTRGPKMLEAAGAAADGTFVEAHFTAAAIARARARLDAGSERAGRGRYDRPYVAWQSVELGDELSEHSVEFAALLIAATPDETLQTMEVPLELAEGLRERRVAAHDVPREQAVKLIAGGNAVELRELVQAARAAGADAWSCVFSGGPEEATRAMGEFGSEVIAPLRTA
jgi:5,10-methylenetetrahydromethanopterin reductase